MMAALTVDQVHSLFAQEADIRLAQLSQLLLQLETTADATLIGSIFREVHTLKGSSAVAGLQEVTDCAHELEELLDDLRTERTTLTPDLIDTLLTGVDRLTALIAVPVSIPAPPAAPTSKPTTKQAILATLADPLTAASASPAAPPRAHGANTVIMVPTQRLEELNRLVGESASAHLRMGRMLKDRFGVDPASCPEFTDLSRSLNDLQDRATRTQMVPVGTVTDQLQRAVRDLSRSQGKDIRWEARGMDTEMDRGTLLQLADGLLHLVRNAVDHGIEPAAERAAAGKPEHGTIRLHAMQLGSEVIIAVTDDGRGIDTQAVSRQAARHGIDTDELERRRVTQPHLSARPVHRHVRQ